MTSPVRLQIEALDPGVYVVPVAQPAEDVWLVPHGRMTAELAAALSAAITDAIRTAVDEAKNSAN
ncbi:hypothetical protein OG948_21430 [Embleya sp. NBC_00888]|uniref:hypothetical protein n=1 Tax=Embleya sp. NBC_00888 TaxID=2975960 RepID=UPI00386B60FB|nr:hypothetical protein OG948_21430 [Embleya sp. NBC_00888]